ncbi:MAG: hypothetical protein HYY08_04610 [Firmicutes bacterium]|nr:hypothetical protein [Bacillota bacterium]
MSLRDLLDSGLPNLWTLLGRGTVGLLNNRTGGGPGLAAAYLTLGAGSRAYGTREAGLVFSEDGLYEGTPAASVYERRTGLRPSEQAVLALDVAEIVRANTGRDRLVVPGALGDALHRAELKTAVLGNSDTPSLFRRNAALIAMDGRGMVDGGDVGRDLLVQDPHAPFGVRTDYTKLLSRVLGLLDEADFVVVELGDATRLAEYGQYMSDSALVLQKGRMLRDLDGFLGQLLAALQSVSSWRLAFLGAAASPVFTGIGSAPTPLTSIVLAGDGLRPGLAFSGTTRWPGLVTNTDVAPTVLEFFGLDVPEGMTGRPIITEPAGRSLSGGGENLALSTVAELERRIGITYGLRPPLLRTFVTVQIAFYLGAFLVVLMAHRLSRRAAGVLHWLLLAITLIPLVLLVPPFIGPGSLSLEIASIAGATVILATLLILYQRKRGVLEVIAVLNLLTAGALAMDLVRGASLMRGSVLGYDPVSGARFYGIGNEYMGVFLGSGIIGLTAFADLLGRRRLPGTILVALAFLGMLFLVAAPSVGANVGGSIAGTAGMGVTLVALLRGRLRGRDVAVMVAAVIGVVGLSALGDLVRGSIGQSHLGAAVRSLDSGGLEQAFMIINRKLAMNLKLLKWSIWSRGLLIALGVFALLFYRPTPLIKGIIAKYPSTAKGLVGTTVTSIVALAVNDSGVVAAATTIMFATSTVLYLAVDAKSRR